MRRETSPHLFCLISYELTLKKREWRRVRIVPNNRDVLRAQSGDSDDIAGDERQTTLHRGDENSHGHRSGGDRKTAVRAVFLQSQREHGAWKSCGPGHGGEEGIHARGRSPKGAGAERVVRIRHYRRLKDEERQRASRERRVRGGRRFEDYRRLRARHHGGVGVVSSHDLAAARALAATRPGAPGSLATMTARHRSFSKRPNFF